MRCWKRLLEKRRRGKAIQDADTGLELLLGITWLLRLVLQNAWTGPTFSKASHGGLSNPQPISLP